MSGRDIRGSSGDIDCHPTPKVSDRHRTASHAIEGKRSMETSPVSGNEVD